MDIEKKVQILRACSSKKGKRCSSCPAFGQGDRNCMRNAMKDAATALSTLQAENEKLRAELEQAKEERDSAISDLTYIARTYPVDLGDDLVCQYCKHYPNANTGCPGWTENDCFEWRSQKEE